MRALAKIMRAKGWIVSGSDIADGGHRAENVADKDLVVYSAAIPDANPELAFARASGIPVMSRAELLGRICGEYPYSVAVAGTHGKTTVTAMLWEVFSAHDPTVHIGGEYRGENCRIGGGDLFITEACEYKRSFLSLQPTVALVLNADLDHTDCYASREEIRESFLRFAKSARQVVYNGDEPNFSPEGISVGLGERNEYRAVEITSGKNGCSFTAIRGGRVLGRIELKVSGEHNALNALFALATALNFGMEFEEAAAGLARFEGVGRRLEKLGARNGKVIYSDYAHHPREIECALKALRECGYSEITAVFEPHTYTRTASFCREFATALRMADRVYLLPVFAARENPIESGRSERIAEECPDFILTDGYDSLGEALRSECGSGAIAFLGAGSIDGYARFFASGGDKFGG